MSRLIDLTGKRFGSLVVLRRVDNGHHGESVWEFQCGCGRSAAASGSSLRRGRVVSCGCKKRESLTTHGYSRTGTYRSWQAMLARCTNPRNVAWPYYGGRGVSVCDRWRANFEAFLEDMGERPDGMSIDRIDPDGDYEPGNCRWATQYEQVHNRRRNSAA